MKGLLLKDFYMMLKYCRSYLLIAVVFFAMSFMSTENLIFIFYPCVISAMLPVTLLSIDERSRWLPYAATLPVTRAQIVSEKYLFGLIAGFFEGRVESVIMMVMDVIFAFPSILLALFIVSALGTSIVNTMIAIGIVNIPVFARTVRASVKSVKSTDYIANARSIGLKKLSILFRHVTPNVMAPFTVQATLALSGAILTEASMSFLGLGIQPPNPSWGSMLSDARKYMERAPWLVIFPALFIIMTILSFNILGDALRDVLDPKLKL